MREEEKKNGPSLITHPASFRRTRAKKSLGQNFLVDERVVERIVGALGPRGDEAIIEIGPGRGELTSRLVERARRVVAVELDRELVPLLGERFRACANFHLVEADALTTDLCALVAPFTRARVVANLPYYISTAILQRLIEQRACIREMILMLQREVVERITARPGSSERGYLSVLVEAYCEAEALFDVAPDSFRPVPKVWSTVVRLSVRPSTAVGVEDEALFRRLVSAGFAQKRKTIFNNLRGAPAGLRSRIEKAGGAHQLLERAQLAPVRRAETLTLEEWAGLARIIEASAPEASSPSSR
ncbi:MAG TPA: 16S rRNA (adenine(1518)-N(6)/adenine(1519)-N(6))-dimethyltransferase RsmA [Pyrinomonadaceae bacterium]|jgi:16S rRNA (adenine1518-N6/adenine1519-N6)-dimethyltransferase|nr:16S rRNA (adenine(1518)-N(6)/adenine(1519)-N(6))-dimethyltransferase RsmA [Pyrinomonadaceae bacterium]